MIASKREQRAREDLRKIGAAGPDPEMEALAAWRSANPLDLSDLDDEDLDGLSVRT